MNKLFCDIDKCLGCRNCEIACAVEHSESKDIIAALKEKPLPKKRVKTMKIKNKVMSLLCRHCDDALCVTACMSGALAKDKKTGAVLLNQDKCVNCWMCVMSCPFGAIVRDAENHIALKCDLCPDRDDYACVSACPTKALFAGTEENFRERIKQGKTGRVSE